MVFIFFNVGSPVSLELCHASSWHQVPHVAIVCCEVEVCWTLTSPEIDQLLICQDSILTVENEWPCISHPELVSSIFSKMISSTYLRFENWSQWLWSWCGDGLPDNGGEVASFNKVIWSFCVPVQTLLAARTLFTGLACPLQRSQSKSVLSMLSAHLQCDRGQGRPPLVLQEVSLLTLAGALTLLAPVLHLGGEGREHLDRVCH